MMTAKARQLGMTHTLFRNASGLPNDQQITTARDIVTLGLRLQDDFPTHYTLFSTRMFNYGGNHYRNHNMLLGTFQGTDGIKTGYTRASGFNIVVSVHRDGKHVVGAVFGGDSASRRDNTMRLALARALMRASPVRTRRGGPALIAEAKPVAPAPAPVRVASAAPPSSTTVAPAPAGQPEITIARVRPVMVAPRPKQAMTDTPPPPPAPAVAPARQPPPPLPVAVQLPPNGRLGLGAAPSTFGQQINNLGRGAPPVTPAVALQPPAPVEVTRPSRIAAQAPAPANPPASTPVRVASTPHTLPQAAAPASGTYEIQIGAYGSAAEAQKALDVTRAKAGNLLGSHLPRTIRVMKDNRQLHRARFAGFDAKSAADVCVGLRKQQVDCFVMKAE
jgi:D-alanyl-D-alanine carboxypeptidase